MSKDPTELTEEEIRMAREFEKKEIAFLEERDKLKKVLCCSVLFHRLLSFFYLKGIGSRNEEVTGGYSACHGNIWWASDETLST